MKPLLFVTLPLYALDQASKWWIVKHFAPYEQRAVIPGTFDLCYFMNTGAAFSIGTGQNLFFVVLSFVALIGVLVFYARGALREPLNRWGTVFLLAGILGNLTDRIVHGHVVDFLLFDLHVRFADPWPAFNVADACICTAVGLFLLASFLYGPEKQQPKRP